MGPFDDVTIFSRYQTFFVGLLGFLGVMATLWWNARLARAARTATIDHDRAVIRTALQEELKAIKSAFVSRVEILEEAEGGSTPQILVPADSLITIYDRLVERLGLLSAEEVRLVLRAYLTAREVPGKLRLLSLQRSNEARGYMVIDRKHFSGIRQLHLGCIGVLDAAIDVLAAG